MAESGGLILISEEANTLGQNDSYPMYDYFDAAIDYSSNYFSDRFNKFRENMSKREMLIFKEIAKRDRDINIEILSSLAIIDGEFKEKYVYEVEIHPDLDPEIKNYYYLGIIINIKQIDGEEAVRLWDRLNKTIRFYHHNISIFIDLKRIN